MAVIGIHGPVTLPRAITATFIYEGGDAIAEGEPFVLDMDADRQNFVKRPTATGGIFAGVADRDYPADAGKRQVTLNLPGSCGIRVKVGATVTKGDVLTFVHASGGGKVFKAATAETDFASAAIGNAITREARTGAGLVKADLAIGPYSDGLA